MGVEAVAESAVSLLSFPGVENGGAGVANDQMVKLFLARFDRIDVALDELRRQRAVQDYYSTEEAASVLGKAEFTVREWCRNGRIQASKKKNGRGRYQAWSISHTELQRVQREGLLPPSKGC